MPGGAGTVVVTSPITPSGSTAAQMSICRSSTRTVPRSSGDFASSDSYSYCAASSHTSCTHLYGTGRLGGTVSACSRNMLGGNEFENVQPETTGRGSVSILTAPGSVASTSWALVTHTASWSASKGARHERWQRRERVGHPDRSHGVVPRLQLLPAVRARERRHRRRVGREPIFDGDVQLLERRPLRVLARQVREDLDEVVQVELEGVEETRRLHRGLRQGRLEHRHAAQGLAEAEALSTRDDRDGIEVLHPLDAARPAFEQLGVPEVLVVRVDAQRPERLRPQREVQRVRADEAAGEERQHVADVRRVAEELLPLLARLPAGGVDLLGHLAPAADRRGAARVRGRAADQRPAQRQAQGAPTLCFRVFVVEWNPSMRCEPLRATATWSLSPSVK